jgi:hypothetical protein
VFRVSRTARSSCGTHTAAQSKTSSRRWRRLTDTPHQARQTQRHSCFQRGSGWCWLVDTSRLCWTADQTGTRQTQGQTPAPAQMTGVLHADVTRAGRALHEGSPLGHQATAPCSARQSMASTCSATSQTTKTTTPPARSREAGQAHSQSSRPSSDRTQCVPRRGHQQAAALRPARNRLMRHQRRHQTQQRRRLRRPRMQERCRSGSLGPTPAPPTMVMEHIKTPVHALSPFLPLEVVRLDLEINHRRPR